MLHPLYPHLWARPSCLNKTKTKKKQEKKKKGQLIHLVQRWASVFFRPVQWKISVSSVFLDPGVGLFRKTRVRIRECESINTRPLTLCLPACPPTLVTSLFFWTSIVYLLFVCVYKKIRNVFVFYFVFLHWHRSVSKRAHRTGRAWEKDPPPNDVQWKNGSLSLSNVTHQSFSDFRLAILFLRCTVYILQHTNTGCNFCFLLLFCFCNLLNVHVYLTYWLDGNAVRTSESFSPYCIRR